ncbi:hypothetical protein U9R90_16195 [Streptomyces sp. E11-3]|uniref:hypothetical protein n=1 Tax=Streptomyces sp. E11-3 TaxID=3110112 RepID=UPI00397EC8EE
MWLQTLDDHVPVLESKLSSRGPYVFRYLGGPATVSVDQRNGGTFWLEELTDRFESAERLIAGKGTCNGKARLNGPTLIHVRSSADWHARIAGGSRGSAPQAGAERSAPGQRLRRRLLG